MIRPLRTLATLSVLASLGLPGGLAAQVEAPCDRACLANVMTRYLASLVTHDPQHAPIAPIARFTEDARELAIGEGLWKSASKVRRGRSDFLDVQEGTAAVQAVLEENGALVLLAARLKVVDREITEIETMVVRSEQEGGLFAPEALTQRSAVMARLPPRNGRMPRDELVEIALRYPEGLRVGSFEKSDVPFAPRAYRLENGVKMAGPGCTFRPPSCENMRLQQIPALAAIKHRVLAVDEENGTVLLWMDFGATSPGLPAQTNTLVVFEAFKIFRGEVYAVEALFQSMPVDTPSGWQ